MTLLLHCFNARKKDACHDGLATVESFFAALVSLLRALQIP
jgi:hypothetical protein